MTIRKVVFTDYARSPLCVWSMSARLLCVFLYSNFTAPVPFKTTLKDVNVYHTYLAGEARRPGRSGYRKEDAREY